MPRHHWAALLRWHILGLSSQAMAREIPPVFRSTVEVDETYLGGAWKNKRLRQRARGTKRGRGTSKTPVFGILCRGGHVWAQVVPDVKARTLLPWLRRRPRPGSMVCSDAWDRDTGVAAKGGIRRRRLPLYLAEYVWRYNHRQLSVNQQVRALMALLTNRAHLSG